MNGEHFVACVYPHTRCFCEQSIVFNDIAVLANFHSSLTFRVLEDEHANIFAQLTDLVSVSD